MHAVDPFEDAYSPSKHDKQVFLMVSANFPQSQSVQSPWMKTLPVSHPVGTGVGSVVIVGETVGMGEAVGDGVGTQVYEVGRDSQHRVPMSVPDVVKTLVA